MLVIGCGSIGRRHARNFKSLGHSVYCYDKDLVKMEHLVSETGAKAYNYTSTHIPMQAWIICTPPELHIGFAMMGLRQGAHIFVEKPISDRCCTPEGSVQDLIALARETGKVLQVGYQLRYSTGLQRIKEIIDKKTFGDLIHIYAEVGQYLPDWHPNENYLQGYTAYTGVILDASHELDYVLWLAGSKVRTVKSMVSKKNPLNIPAESCADILLEFENDVIANVHLDMLQRTYERRCRIIMERMEIPWQFISEKEDLYLKEICRFVECIEGKATPLVAGEDGLKTLLVALNARGEHIVEGEVI